MKRTKQIMYAAGVAVGRELQGKPVRWVRVRDITDGWLTVNIDGISEIRMVGSGLALRMMSGSLILITSKEADRLIRKLTPLGIEL